MVKHFQLYFVHNLFIAHINSISREKTLIFKVEIESILLHYRNPSEFAIERYVVMREV